MSHLFESNLECLDSIGDQIEVDQESRDIVRQVEKLELDARRRETEILIRADKRQSERRKREAENQMRQLQQLQQQQLQQQQLIKRPQRLVEYETVFPLSHTNSFSTSRRKEFTQM